MAFTPHFFLSSVLYLSILVLLLYSHSSKENFWETKLTALTASPRRCELAMEKKIIQRAPMPPCCKSLLLDCTLTPEPSWGLAGTCKNVLHDFWSRPGLACPRTAPRSAGAKAEDHFHLFTLPKLVCCVTLHQICGLTQPFCLCQRVNSLYNMFQVGDQKGSLCLPVSLCVLLGLMLMTSVFVFTGNSNDP